MTCRRCSKEFSVVVKNQRFCTRGCQAKQEQEKYASGYPALPTGSLGAVSELEVAKDLVLRGYYVFRSLTPNSPCDLVAIKGGVLYKIEVKTAVHDSKVKDSLGKYDILARVHQGKIIYIPDML